MKLAISTENGQVAAHFGRCAEYTLVEVADDCVANQQLIPNPGHEPGFLPRYLADRNVDIIITGGMGPRAQSLFNSLGIETLIGVQGRVSDVVEAFLDGSLALGDSLCEHDQEETKPCH